MISKKIKANLFLLFFFLLAIFFYGYFINENEGLIKIKNIEKTDSENLSSKEKVGVTSFTDVEYKSISKNNKTYITRGKQAYLSKDQPELILLNTVYSFTQLNDGSVLHINSDNAQYNKITKNIKYYSNVIIKNKNALITANKANFFYNKNLIRLENAVYKDGSSLLRGDFAELNTISNDLNIFMKNKNNQVYGQRKKN